MSPGTDDVIGSPEAAVIARPDTAQTRSGEDKQITVEKLEDEKAKPNNEKDNKVPVAKPAKKKGPVVSRLNQYAMYDKNHPLNKPFPAIESFKGPKSTHV